MDEFIQCLGTYRNKRAKPMVRTKSTVVVFHMVYVRLVLHGTYNCVQLTISNSPVIVVILVVGESSCLYSCVCCVCVYVYMCIHNLEIFCITAINFQFQGLNHTHTHTHTHIHLYYRRFFFLYQIIYITFFNNHL